MNSTDEEQRRQSCFTSPAENDNSNNHHHHYHHHHHQQQQQHHQHHHTPSPSLASLLNPTHSSSSSSSSLSPTTPVYHPPHQPSLPYPPTQHQPLRDLSSLQTPRLSEPSVDRPLKRTKLTPDHLQHPHLSRSNTPERSSQSPQSISTTITLQSNEDRPQRSIASITDPHHQSPLEHLPPLINPHLPPIFKQHRSFSTPTNRHQPPLSSNMIDPHHYPHPKPIIATDYHHHHQSQQQQDQQLQPAHPIKNTDRLNQRSTDQPNSKHHHPYPTRSPTHSYSANLTRDRHDPSSSSTSSSRASTTASSTTTLTIQSHLEESVFGIAPYDDFTWTIAQFIWKHAQPYWERGEGHLIEVEAKLGTIREKRNSGDRIYFPIGTEAPILDTRDTRFETDMPIQQHETLNRLLNQRVTETNSTGYSGSKVEYTHTKEVDEFYESKVRVTRDSRNNHHPSTHNIPPNKSIIKEKLAHLDVHCPARPFDFRISVNVEQPVPLPHEHATPNFKRMKDRVSYSHQICQIDLTQVKSSDQNGLSTHEVEVEFKDSNELLRAASVWFSSNSSTNPASTTDSEERESACREEDDYRGMAGEAKNPDGHYYLLMVEVMLNNVRMLIRNC